ncbi:MAG: Ig-like domain-containing protein [Gemmatimonadota bacterium]|nr:MAG: Ig-like domain-containing protein [Gemmatimonadota bacterium]
MDSNRVASLARRMTAAVAAVAVVMSATYLACDGDPEDPRVPVASVEVTPSQATIDVGATVQLTAEPRDVDGDPLSGRAVTWSSDAEAVATVDGSGLVTGVADGTTTITAASEGMSGTATVTVIESLATLDCGDNLPASIEEAAEVDEYTFSTTVDDAFILVSLTSTGGVVVDGRLIDPEGTEVRSFRASTVQRIEAPAAGLYRVRVNSATLRDVGTYRIGLECIDPLGPVEGDLESGDLVSEDLPLPGEVDLFTFTAAAGDHALLPIANTQGVVADVTLLAPSRAVELTFRAHTLPLVTLAETGRYVMYVHTATLVSTGAYNLGLESVAPLGPVQGDLVRNSVISEAIATPGEVDLFTLTGDGGSDFLMSVANTSGIRVDAVILSPDGDEVDRITGNSQKSIRLPATGTYVVYVFSTTGHGLATYNIGVI